MKNGKWITAGLLAVGLSMIPGLTETVFAAPVAINSTNFPDQKFRDYIARFDTDANHTLSDAEIAAAEVMDCNRRNISNLKGIEYFTSLTELDCSRNILAELDVSANTSLEYLDCHSNKLTSLDVSGSTSLRELYCNDNQLAELDVSANTSLELFNCKDNQLVELDVSANTALQALDCSSNQLTLLDISSATTVREIVLNETVQIFGVNSDVDLYANSDKTAGLAVDKDVRLITDRFTVTFHTDGGSAIAPQIIEAEIAMPHSNERIFGKALAVEDPQRAGYTFAGWYSDASLETEFDFESEIKADTDIYAGWEADSAIFTVSFDANGHGTAPTPQSVAEGMKAVKPADLTQSGRTFGGWYREADCIHAFDFETPITGDVTLFAKWTEVASGSGSGSGGGSNSGNSSSSGNGSDSGGRLSGGSVSASANSGSWMQDSKGWWYQYSNGSYAKNEWKQLPYSKDTTWYAFNEEGYLRTGWFLSGSHWYYLSEANDASIGKLVTGWTEIGGKWYYLEPDGNAAHPQGAMYAGEKTPDGYTVDDSGAWVK